MRLTRIGPPDLDGRLAGVPSTDDVHFPAPVDQRLGVPEGAAVPQEEGMDDDQRAVGTAHFAHEPRRRCTVVVGGPRSTFGRTIPDTPHAGPRVWASMCPLAAVSGRLTDTMDVRMA